MSIPIDPVHIAALRAAVKNWEFRYDILSADGEVARTSQVMSCSVSNNWLADIKRTCSVVMAPRTDGPTGSINDTFNQLNERIRPWAILETVNGPVEYPVGTFFLSASNTRKAAPAGERGIPFEGYDMLLALQESKLTFRQVATAGNSPDQLIFDLIDDVDAFEPYMDILAIPKMASFTADMEWAPGTSRLKVINDILAAFNFTPLRMDPMGNPTTGPYQAPDVQPPIWDYTIDANSVVFPGIDVNLDLFNVPNVWIATVSQPDRTELTSTFTNSAATSLTSTTTRGRTIVEVVDSLDAADQPTLDAIVAKYAQESSQIFEEASFDTGLMPFHDDGDVIRLDYGDGLLNFREQEWSVDLTVGGTMKHVARRVVML